VRILVIEDERDLALGLRANLEVEGYEVAVAHTGEDGLQIADEWAPDLVLLDLMLPGIDGYETLARIRKSGTDVPVLILTARGEEVDKVRGFRTGADDYVTKPFGVMELLVRIQAILKRAGRPVQAAPASTDRGRAPKLQRVGRAEIDAEDRVVRRDGAEVALAPKAFDLLLALLSKEGRVISRHELLRDVWGYSASVTTRTVDAHIAELRRKLEDDPGEPKHILTVWKVGYRLRA
jgi:two-component system, OmpR family, alkaline phosphatase synthesis response regulator PhoP